MFAGILRRGLSAIKSDTSVTSKDTERSREAEEEGDDEGEEEFKPFSEISNSMCCLLTAMVTTR